ncbi:MAG: hypothetical protein ACSLE2_08050 [Lysobacterales bacterium]
MKVGEQAELTRTYHAADLVEYAEVSGHRCHDSRSIPEPLIGALFSCLLGVHLPGLGTMYLKQETRFLADAKLGAPLRARVEITGMRPEKHLVDLATTCWNDAGERVAEGRALVYVRDVYVRDVYVRDVSGSPRGDG